MNKHNRHLHDQINIAGIIWNHVLALQKWYYRLTGKYCSQSRLKKHIARLRMHTQKYSYWKALNSQTVQEIIERQDEAYQRFFKGLAKRPPKFKKVKKFKSIVLKQAGWKLLDDNKIRIHGHIYKFVKHREIESTIKTVTIKRDSCNRLFVIFSVVQEVELPERVMTGETAGLDFGLKTFLTDHTGHAYQSPEFLRQDLQIVRQLSREFSRKQVGSKAWHRAKYALARAQIRVSHKRRDSHFKLAHELCDKFDVIYLEDLNIDGMKRLWGRKISDLGFADFVTILKWVAQKRQVQVVCIDRWTPTSKTCSTCGHGKDMALHDRIYECTNCGLVLDRDHNAALNIQRVGASTRLPEVS